MKVKELIADKRLERYQDLLHLAYLVSELLQYYPDSPQDFLVNPTESGVRERIRTGEIANKVYHYARDAKSIINSLGRSE